MGTVGHPMATGLYHNINGLADTVDGEAGDGERRRQRTGVEQEERRKDGEGAHGTDPENG